jgi:hypothetical protein
MIILNKSKSNLTEGFNEAIYESDLKNDQEINEALKRKSSQLEQIEQKCISKMNEYKIKIEDINKNTKQNQIDSFKNTLDLDLDNLVEYSDYGDDEMYDFKIKPSKNENEENLLIESDDILLNEIDIDKADNIEVEIELDTEKKYIKDTDTNNKVNIYFKKTTEIDIQKQYIDNPIESRNIDVKITTHIDDEIFESFNHKPILPREQIEDEELDVKITHESSFKNKEGEYENIELHMPGYIRVVRMGKPTSLYTPQGLNILTGGYKKLRKSRKARMKNRNSTKKFINYKMRKQKRS